MKISYNWIKQFLKLDLPPKEVSIILTDLGLEVEGMATFESIKGSLNGVIVGEVLECEKHRNADRLKVTQVDLGNEKVQIICGAPNVAIGQKSPCCRIRNHTVQQRGRGFFDQKE